MNLLLDTHAILWWMADDPKLPDGVRRAISDRNHVVHVSAASIWEMGIKTRLGKLVLPQDWYEVLKQEPFAHLPMTAEHAVEASCLPLIHSDPFDRMLVAQARQQKLTLVTADSQIPRYDVQTLPWE
jgi:PIN domain nuclease of toxin-antitoxin system